MRRVGPLLGAALALSGASGCAVQVASWSAAAARAHPAEAAPAAVRGYAEGRSCRWWVLAVPVGLPRIEEAMADALARVHGRAMQNLTVTSEHTFYGPVGQHCYAVKGDVVG